jgi:uncharacterized membrane protein
VLVVRQIYHPDKDLVRFGGRIDDPSGGVFDSAPDAAPRWLPSRLRPRAEAPRELVETADPSSERVVSVEHLT